MRSLACVLLFACGSPSVNGPRNAPGPIPGEAPPTSSTEATAPPQPDPQLAHPARPEHQAAPPLPVVTSDPAPPLPPTTTSPANVTFGELQLAGGTIDREGVKRAIEHDRARIRACYANEQAEVPSLAGKITAKWTIELDGTVKQVSTSAGITLTVSQCVGDTIRAIHFPKPARAATATLVFAFAPT
jgi:hypothetical protein